MGYSLGLDTRPNMDLARCLVSELVGTAFLVLVGCGAAINWETPGDYTQISLAFGLVVMAMVAVFGPVSGGHLNPAVSVGLLAGGEMSLIKCLLYIVVQMVGAVLGAGVLYGATPPNVQGLLGTNLAKVGIGRSFLIETVLTMMLVLVVYATAVDKANSVSPGLAPLIIGLTVAAAHLVCIPFTGTSINPARSFGASVVSDYAPGKWTHHWIFWVAPLLGGALGGLFYNSFLRKREKEVESSKEVYQVETIHHAS